MVILFAGSLFYENYLHGLEGRFVITKSNYDLKILVIHKLMWENMGHYYALLYCHSLVNNTLIIRLD